MATKLPGMPETHDKEKSNGNGSLSVREIRLERLDRFKLYSRVLPVALIRQCCCGQQLMRHDCDMAFAKKRHRDSFVRARIRFSGL